MSILKKKVEGFKGERIIRTPKSIWELQAANPICRQLYITDIGYYPYAKYHYWALPRGRIENVLLYCEKGQGWIEYKDTVYRLSKHQAFVIPAHETHAYGADNNDPWSIYWFHFCGENVSLFNSIFGQVIHVKDADNSRYEDRFQLFEEMYQNLEMDYSPENLEYVSICLTHFIASLKYINQFREIKKAKLTDTIQKSISFMREHLESKITLEDIARHVGYSSAHFGALFSKKTSLTPMEYYNQLKIQRSCSYLHFSDMKIKEIAFRLGYSNPFHFSRAFKKEMEITPKEYRIWYIKNNDTKHRSLMPESK